jgi:hypothetical protein
MHKIDLSMRGQDPMKSPRITVVDLELAAIYYPILVEKAKRKLCITYGELVDLAKNLHPDNPVIQNALAISTGRRLDVVRMFTSAHGLPDLSSLVVNGLSGECGSGFTRNFDPGSTRDQVFNFDWQTVRSPFVEFMESIEKKTTRRQSIRRSEALEMVFKYYVQNKSKLPQKISIRREKIVDAIMSGMSIEEAFAVAAQSLSDPTSVD